MTRAVRAGAHASTLYRPYPQQRAIHADPARFKVLVCHRRFGKTVLAVNALIDAAALTKQPNARFAYIAPTYPQAKRAAWDYLKRFAAAVEAARFDAGLVAAVAAAGTLGKARRDRPAEAHENELRLDFANGARIQLHGADDPDSLRGIYLDGVVFDEFGQMPPGVWSEVVRPMLVDRKGFALFIGTPKGQNAFFDLWRATAGRAGWQGYLHKASETGLLPAEELAAARRDMSPEEYEQEFECSFSAAILGAYFGREIAQAEAAGRVRPLAYDPRHPVYTGWDIGYNDPTAIWFVQMVPALDGAVEARWIDYYQHKGEGLDHYVRVLNAKDYRYAAHYLPHDVGHHEWGQGATRLSMLRDHGLEVRVAPMLPIDDGIEAVRRILRRSAFDGGRCKPGLDALRHYRSEWDERRGVFVRQPLHDWASHAADAARSFALGFETRSRLTPSSREDTADQHYDIMRW
jgi:hypothetical protein